MSVTSVGAESYNNSDGIQLPSSPLKKLLTEKLKNSTKRMVLLHLIFVIYLLLRSEFCQCSRRYRNSDQNFEIPLTEAPVSLVGKLRSEFLRETSFGLMIQKVMFLWKYRISANSFRGYSRKYSIGICKFIHQNNLLLDKFVAALCSSKCVLYCYRKGALIDASLVIDRISSRLLLVICLLSYIFISYGV